MQAMESECPLLVEARIAPLGRSISFSPTHALVAASSFQVVVVRQPGS